MIGRCKDCYVNQVNILENRYCERCKELHQNLAKDSCRGCCLHWNEKRKAWYCPSHCKYIAGSELDRVVDADKVIPDEVTDLFGTLTKPPRKR